MEVIVKKKIELQRIKEQRELYDEIERKKRLEETVIQEIIGKQQQDNADLLMRALKRGDVLEENYKRPEMEIQKQDQLAKLLLKGNNTEQEK